MSRKDPPLFHFVVFSVVEDDNVKPKIVQCPNCGVLHRILDIGRSKILTGKEESKSLVTFDDIKTSMPPNLAKILEQHDLDMTQWEAALFIVENQRWGDYIVLSDESVDKIRYVKYVRILGNDLYRVDTQEFEE
jgi:hypothetical protein